MTTNDKFSEWYRSTLGEEPSYRDAWDAAYQAGVDSVRYEGELPPFPVGDRFKNNLKFRPLGTGGGDVLYEVWGDAIKDYARQAIAGALVKAEASYRAELDKVSERNYQLCMELAKVWQSEPVAIADGTFNHDPSIPLGTPLYTTPQPEQPKTDTDLINAGCRYTTDLMAPQPAPAAQPDAQLCKFYGVTTYPELVAVMEHHIRKLQAKLPISDVIAIQRVREG